MPLAFAFLDKPPLRPKREGVAGEPPPRERTGDPELEFRASEQLRIRAICFTLWTDAADPVMREPLPVVLGLVPGLGE